MLGEYPLEADRCTLRLLARPWDPYRTHRAASVAAPKILSKIGVDGRREAALKLLTLVLLLVGKRTLGPKTAKTSTAPPSRVAAIYALEPATCSLQPRTVVASGAAHRERANESEATSTIPSRIAAQ